MILPVSSMISTLNNLQLPIYMANNGHKCHFKDVCIQLTKVALKNVGFCDDGEFKEDPMLCSEWMANYEALKTQVKMED